MTEQSYEPSIEEIKTAFDEAINASCSDCQGWKSESIHNLRTIRNKKTTWVFEEENKLRFAIDRFLNQFN
jgi:hypothetical protein